MTFRVERAMNDVANDTKTNDNDNSLSPNRCKCKWKEEREKKENRGIVNLAVIKGWRLHLAHVGIYVLQ